jgi:hypothetical protein
VLHDGQKSYFYDHRSCGSCGDWAVVARAPREINQRAAIDTD